MERNDYYESVAEDTENIHMYIKAPDYVSWFLRTVSDLVDKGYRYDSLRDELRYTSSLFLKTKKFIKENGLTEKYNEYMNRKQKK